MPVSPADFALWARATGNKYPETVEEKIAVAPHAYEYARNLGRTGQSAPTNRVGGNILYSNPESVQNPSPNSLFNAPVTPDNNARKVAGTIDKTLTSEHFVNQEQNEVENTNRTRQIIDTVGKTALAAGALAAGVALARNPGVQQSVRSAGTSIKENAQDISSRVSNFLGGFGGGQNIDPSTVRNSGDVTPPTTGQRYQQEQVPTSTQEIQVAKGAPAGAPEKSFLETKPVTESEVISTSQTFAPGNKPTKQQIIQSILERSPIQEVEREYVPKQSFTSGPVSKDVLQARTLARRQELDALDQARANASTSYQPSIPGVNPTLYSLRSQGDVDLSTGGVLNETTKGWQKTPSYEGTQLNIPFKTSSQSSAQERASDFLAQVTQQPPATDIGSRLASAGIAMSGAPEHLGGTGVFLYHEPVGKETDLNHPASEAALAKAGVSKQEALNYWSQKLSSLYETPVSAASSLAPTGGIPYVDTKRGWGFFGGSPESEAAAFPVRLSKTAPILSPFSRQETARPVSKQIIRVPGSSKSAEYTEKPNVTRLVPLNTLVEEAPLAGARPLRENPNVIRLAGARDIEAAGETLRSQGVVPLGPFSSVLSGTTYQSPFDVSNPMAALNIGTQTNPTAPSSNLFSGVVSGIDPRIATTGEQNVRSRVEGYLGGKQAWTQKNIEQANILRQRQLSQGTEGLATLKQMSETHPNETVRNKALTLTKQIDALYDITQDPGLISGISQVDLSPETVASTRTNDLVQAIAPQLTLPGGEVIPTSAFYRAHKAVGFGENSNLTQVQGYEQQLIEKQRTHSHTQSLALSQLRSMVDPGGNPVFPHLQPSAPGEQPPVRLSLSSQEFKALPKATQNQLRQTRDAVVETQNRLETAKGNELLFHIPENILEGVNMRPVFSELTGEVSGFEPVPMERTMAPVARHAFESGKGIGRADVGGVGRRREELQQQFETELASGSLSDPEPVMYKDVDSGAFVHPDDVTALDIHMGRVRAVTGETATAQRILGSGGRGFNLQGTSAASFDPGRVSEVAKQHPELMSPEGLLYSPEAMVSATASKEAAKSQRQLESAKQEMLQAGNVKGALFIGKMRALAENKKVAPGSEHGIHLTSLNNDQLNETIMQAQFAGMHDVAEAASQVLEARTNVKNKALGIAASEATLRKSGLGRMNPETQQKEFTARPATRSATTLEKLFALAHTHAAVWGGLPKSQTIPLEEHVRQPSQNMYRNSIGQQLSIPNIGFGQVSPPDKTREVIKQAQLNDLLAKYTGRSLQGALQGALYTQPTLF